MTEISSAVQHHHRRRGEANPLDALPALLEAALDEFSQRAFDEASLNRIIAAAGMNKGSFYYRFAGKLDLYLCMAEVIYRRKMAAFAQASAGESFPEDFFEQVRVLAATGLAFARQEPRYHALAQRLLAETGSVRRAIKEAFPEAARDVLQPLVEAARSKGQFRPEFPDAFVKGIIELLGSQLDSLMPPDADAAGIAALVDHLLDMLKWGLGVRPDQSPT